MNIFTRNHLEQRERESEDPEESKWGDQSPLQGPYPIMVCPMRTRPSYHNQFKKEPQEDKNPDRVVLTTEGDILVELWLIAVTVGPTTPYLSVLPIINDGLIRNIYKLS